MQDRKKPRAKRPFVTIYYGGRDFGIVRKAYAAYLSTAVGSATRRLALRKFWSAAEIIRRDDEKLLINIWKEGRTPGYNLKLEQTLFSRQILTKEAKDGR